MHTSGQWPARALAIGGCAAPCRSETKFNSGCGWPAFYAEIPGAVDRHEDISYGMKRVEITCASCGGHLGHVFEGEGFPTPTDARHCVNSRSVKFTPQA
jgi:peptide-methionine (R)-S-oxide reductase